MLNFQKKMEQITSNWQGKKNLILISSSKLTDEKLLDIITDISVLSKTELANEAVNDSFYNRNNLLFCKLLDRYVLFVRSCFYVTLFRGIFFFESLSISVSINKKMSKFDKKHLIVVCVSRINLRIAGSIFGILNSLF